MITFNIINDIQHNMWIYILYHNLVYKLNYDKFIKLKELYINETV